MAFVSGFSLILLAGIMVYNFFVFRSYSYKIWAHYAGFVIYSISTVMEFHGLVHAEEAVTFVSLAVSSAALVVKVLAGVNYDEKLRFMLDYNYKIK